MYGSRSHIVKFYDNGAFLDDLINHHSSLNTTLLIATKENIDSFRKRFNGRHKDKGIILMNAEETLSDCMINGEVDKKILKEIMKKILKNTHKKLPLEIYCEMVALLWIQGKRDQAIKLEKIWSDLCERYNFKLFCVQPITSIGNETNHLSIRDLNQLVEEHNATSVI